MTKFRIIKTTMEDCSEKWSLQERRLLVWFMCEGERDSHPHRNMPSVDKIEPSLGYVVGNIAWTYYYVNRAKNDLNLEEFLNLCQLINSNFIRA